MKPSTFRLGAFAPATGLLLGLALACGGLGGDSSTFSSSYGGRSPPDSKSLAELDTAYRVPPDRAVIAIAVNVAHPTAAEVSTVLAAEVTKLTQALAGVCPATLLDQEPASAAWGGATASAELRVDVDLRGLPGVPERNARIEACLAALDPLLTSGASRKGPSTREVQRSSPALVVDTPEQHRDVLLGRARTRLEWAAAATGVPQLHPEDLRCVPDGTVLVGDRRLSGVVLTLGMPCRIEVLRPANAGAPAVASD